MPHRLIRMHRAGGGRRPVMLAIAGDSASGKTTLTQGLVQAIGPDRMTAICVDDYHRHNREERRGQPFTALHPEANYLEIMEQHLQLLAMGQPVLKPVYDHDTGQLIRPVLVEPTEFVVVEGLLPLHSKLTRASFDIAVYLDPPEEIRHAWKIKRDTTTRGYTREQVVSELARRERESEAFIHPQRRWADIVVRFAPVAKRQDPPETPLSAELMLRPTIDHPDLSAVVGESDHRAMHLKLIRDTDGRPVDALHVHGYVADEDSAVVKKSIWDRVAADGPVPEELGALSDGTTSNPLAITQLLLLYHLLEAAREQR